MAGASEQAISLRLRKFGLLNLDIKSFVFLLFITKSQIDYDRDDQYAEKRKSRNSLLAGAGAQTSGAQNQESLFLSSLLSSSSPSFCHRYFQHHHHFLIIAAFVVITTFLSSLILSSSSTKSYHQHHHHHHHHKYH